ncbi:MAG: hypothetical protein QOC73_1848, partial [Actinomycetota bacterium]|nr:hypothetical protein [Actinomycetota bacterium]
MTADVAAGFSSGWDIDTQPETVG